MSAGLLLQLGLFFFFQRSFSQNSVRGKKFSVRKLNGTVMIFNDDFTAVFSCRAQDWGVSVNAVPGMAPTLSNILFVQPACDKLACQMQ